MEAGAPEVRVREGLRDGGGLLPRVATEAKPPSSSQAYVDEFKFQSIMAEDFLEFYLEYFPELKEKGVDSIPGKQGNWTADFQDAAENEQGEVGNHQVMGSTFKQHLESQPGTPGSGPQNDSRWGWRRVPGSCTDRPWAQPPERGSWQCSSVGRALAGHV